MTSSHMTQFLAVINERNNSDLSDYEALHKYSIEHTGEFWGAVADYCGIIWQTPPKTNYQAPPAGKMRGAKWFSGSKINFAENLLLKSNKNKAVIVSHAEGASRRELSQEELRISVGRCAAALRKSGVKKGDRVAGIIGNLPEAIIGMLGAASIGAVWSSCSPDFGAKGIMDRLSQVKPRVVFYTTSYQYGGKNHSTSAVMEECLKNLGSCLGVAVDHLQNGDVPIDGAISLNEFLDIAPDFRYEACEFGDPLYIMFSSGTTGVPKCIVHGIGGTLIQHKKELMLHSNIDHEANLLYFTTCGWMMWNWMVSALSCDAMLTLFEGSPLTPI